MLLKISFYSWNVFLQRRFSAVLLTLFTITGSVLGVLSARYADTLLVSLMNGNLFSSVSIVCRTFLLLLPYFAVSLAAIYSISFALIPVCFLKVFGLAYCTMGLWLTFGSAGWLVCNFLLVADIFSAFVLVRLCFRHIEGFRETIGKEIVCSVLFTLVLSCVENIFLAPLYASIMM